MDKRGLLLLIAALTLHLFSVLSPAWTSTHGNKNGRDFASYYYAIVVAAEGQNPYQTRLLSRSAQEDKTRKAVHPFLYAPPFLLLMAWAIPTDLTTAYEAWFWLHELALIVTALALFGWWRQERSVGYILALIVAAMTAIPNNHLMGQANFFGLALAMGGCWAAEQKKPVIGGAMMGAACMLKMSPAMLVIWWIIRREWTAVISACITAVILSVLTLPLASVQTQMYFYRTVLPGFSNGSYNGLSVPIGLFGNHSIPNLWHQAIGGGTRLSGTAKSLSTLSNLALVAGAALCWYRATGQRARIAQACSVCVALLLIPVYTYEHHLVWAIPAMVWCCVRLERQPLWMLLMVGMSIGALCVDLQDLKRWCQQHPGALAGLVQESKTIALFTLMGVSGWLGRVDTDTAQEAFHD